MGTNKFDPKLLKEYDLHEIGEFCTPAMINMQYVEYLVSLSADNNITPDTCYMSTDVFAELTKQLAATARGLPPSAGLNKLELWTSIGRLDVMPIPHLTNFVFLGTKESLEKQIWDKVGQRFEEIFLQDDNK